jgi:hypothetical protein
MEDLPRVVLKGPDGVERAVKHHGDLGRRQETASGDSQHGIDVAREVRAKAGGVLYKSCCRNPSVGVDHKRLGAGD